MASENTMKKGSGDELWRAQPPAGAGIGVLPTEVLYDILLCVPAVDVLRLVCRSWRSITCDRDFARAHASRHPLVVGLASGRRREIQFVDLSGNVVRRISSGQSWNVDHLSTDGDLVCAQSRINGGMACVIEPSSGTVTVLPTDTGSDDDSTRGHPATTFFVLGHVPSTGEYKVLRIRLDFSGDIKQVCDILTLGNGSGSRDWRAVPGPPPPFIISMFPALRTVVNGVAYFLQFLNPYNGVKQGDMVSFDLGTEDWSPTLRRGPLNGDQRTAMELAIQVAQMNGCLVQVTTDGLERDGSAPSRDLWFSEDVEEGLWTKRYSLPCPPISLDGRFFPPLLMVVNDKRVPTCEVWKRVLRAYDPGFNDLSTVTLNHRSLTVYRGSLL